MPDSSGRFRGISVPNWRDQVSDSDRELIEWASKAQVGELLPEGYRHMYGTHELVARLVELGVMPEPPADASISKVAVDAQQAAAAWLAELPEARQ